MMAGAGPLVVAILVCQGHNNQPNFGVIEGGIGEDVRPRRDVGRRHNDVSLAVKIFNKK